MDWERKREGEKEKKNREREGKCGKSRVRSSHFSLEFPTSSDEARSKVAPHGKDYTWVPVLGSFNKLRKGRGFSPTCFTFCLRAM